MKDGGEREKWSGSFVLLTAILKSVLVDVIFFLFDTVRRTEIKNLVVFFTKLGVLCIEHWVIVVSIAFVVIAVDIVVLVIVVRWSNSKLDQSSNFSRTRTHTAHSNLSFHFLWFADIHRKLVPHFVSQWILPNFPHFNPSKVYLKLPINYVANLAQIASHARTLSKYTHYQQNKPILIKNAEKNRTTSYALYRNQKNVWMVGCARRARAFAQIIQYAIWCEEDIYAYITAIRKAAKSKTELGKIMALWISINADHGHMEWGECKRS